MQIGAVGKRIGLSVDAILVRPCATVWKKNWSMCSGSFPISRNWSMSFVWLSRVAIKRCVNGPLIVPF